MRLIYLLLTICLASVSFADTKVPSGQVEMQLSFAPLVKQASPAVVNIFANRIVEQRQNPFMGNPFFEDFFRGFGQTQPRMQNSLGSGVILSADGIVVSNYHVVGMATDIRVVLNDRREFNARVLLGDQESDLAILKIDAEQALPWLDLRNSAVLEAHASAPTSILTRSGGSNGVGFAIPANLVARFVEQAQSGNEAFARPWAGVFGQVIDKGLSEGLGQRVPEGVILSAMHPLSPFATAGLQVGDVVLAIDGQAVNAPAEMLFRMSVRPLGDEIEVLYLRGGGEDVARVFLITAPDEPPSLSRTVPDGVVLEGLSVATVNPKVIAELGLPIDAAGVVVTRVPRQLQRIGLRRGAILTGINRTQIETPDDVLEAAGSDQRGWRLDGTFRGQRFSYRFRL